MSSAHDSLRRKSVRLPVRIEHDDSALGQAAARMVARSPRFDSDDRARFVVRIDGAAPQACLLGPNSEQLSCARVNLPADIAPRPGARLLIAELHQSAFAFRSDLSQSDLSTLDGSPTAARADQQVKQLIDQVGTGGPAGAAEK